MKKSLFVEREGHIVRITPLSKQEFEQMGLVMTTNGIVLYETDIEPCAKLCTINEVYSNPVPSDVHTASNWENILYCGWFESNEESVKTYNIQDGFFDNTNFDQNERNSFENRPVSVFKKIIAASRLLDSSDKETQQKANILITELQALLGTMDESVVSLNTKRELLSDPFFDNLENQ